MFRRELPDQQSRLSDSFSVGSTNADYIVALAGNPNTGKSTVFNHLTGLNQHTGNWAGKTVAQARGMYTHNGRRVLLVDLPGTYSLLSRSPEEEIARDFICFADPDATVVMTDATCLERNLNLVLQVMEMTPRVVVCLNLIDEARRKGIEIDCARLSDRLGVPIIPTAARNGYGLGQLKDSIEAIASRQLSLTPLEVRYPLAIERQIEALERELAPVLSGKLKPRWVALRLLDGDQSIIKSIERHLGLRILNSRKKVPA